ncbi:hypothetical protein ACHAW6_003861 [Cyclotella cf. meneghiniana]
MTTAEVKGQLFTDQTGLFPVTSNCRHNYIVIFYVVDAITSNLTPSSLATAPNFSKFTVMSINTCEFEDTGHNFTTFIMKLLRTLRTTLNCNILHLTSTELTQPCKQSTHGKITLLQSEPAHQKPIGSPTGAKTWNINMMTPNTQNPNLLHTNP